MSAFLQSGRFYPGETPIFRVRFRPEGAVRLRETFAHSIGSGDRTDEPAVDRVGHDADSSALRGQLSCIAGEYERDHGFRNSHVNNPCISIVGLEDEGSPEGRLLYSAHCQPFAP